MDLAPGAARVLLFQPGMRGWEVSEELERLLANVPVDPDSPREVTPLGVDSLLPAGWRDEAHHQGRSPWDAELRLVQLQDTERQLMDALEEPSEHDAHAVGRVPRDRRVTELDWRQLVPTQDA